MSDAEPHPGIGQDPCRTGGHARRRPPRGRRPRHDRAADRARHDDRRNRPDLPRLHRQRAACDPGTLELQGISEVDLHLGQPRGLPRHPGRQGPEGRRHPQCGHHRHQGRLPRRHQPHVPGRRAVDPGPAAVRHGLRGHVARHPHDPPGHAPRRPRPHDPGLRRGPGLLGRARVLRPRHRPGLPRGPAGPALRRAGHRPGARGRA